jgi:hypothetical protein
VLDDLKDCQSRRSEAQIRLFQQLQDFVGHVSILAHYLDKVKIVRCDFSPARAIRPLRPLDASVPGAS